MLTQCLHSAVSHRSALCMHYWFNSPPVFWFLSSHIEGSQSILLEWMNSQIPIFKATEVRCRGASNVSKVGELGIRGSSPNCFLSPDTEKLTLLPTKTVALKMVEHSRVIMRIIWNDSSWVRNYDSLGFWGWGQEYVFSTGFPRWLGGDLRLYLEIGW